MSDTTNMDGFYDRPVYAGLCGWSVWYAGGSVVRSTDLAWGNLPMTGLQVLMLYFTDEHREIVAGYDEYAYPNEAAKPLGSLIDDAAFEAIYMVAFADIWRP